MNIHQQSSKAQDRTLSVWFQKVQNGEIKLPRFQRHQAWDKKRITSLLDTISYNLPLGITLILDIGDEEKFDSRYLVTAPETGGKVNEHLLDGQQRLTALWRCMNNNYKWEKYFIYIPEFDNEEDGINFDQMTAYCQGRWTKREKLYPLWADAPKYCFKKGLIPVDLLRPFDMKSEIDTWINAAVGHLMPDKQDTEFADKYQFFFEKKTELDKKITELREIISHYNLPYLALPSSTSVDIALQVFINMNTNTKPLSLYDVVVAEVESAKSVSLHELQAELNEKHPRVKDYFQLEQLVLVTSALIQDKLPNNKGALEMSKSTMVDNWDQLMNGLSKMVAFMENEGIYSRQVLPTNAVLGVIASLYTIIPETLDARGKAEILLRKYLWSSFFTDRYENTAASRAFRDYTVLKKVILKEHKENGQPYTEQDVPVLDREFFAISDIDFLTKTGWAKRENIRARAIICVASKLGAYDFADGQKLTLANLKERDYHHIFPKALLQELNVNPDLALNCALITSSTNKSLGAKPPLEYIKERTKVFDNDTIRQRLNSHLIPMTRLLELDAVDSLEENYIERQYKQFLKERAGLIYEAAAQLCDGKNITIDSVLSSNKSLPVEVKELDEEVSKIEIATRRLIAEKLDANKNAGEVFNEKLIESAEGKYNSWLKKNAGVEKEKPITVRTALNNLTLSDYKDILTSKQHWHLFEDIFEAKGNIMNRYTQLGTLRNRIRHDNEPSTVEIKDGEAAIEWFNIALMEYLD